MASGDLKWRRIGYAVKRGIHYLGAQTTPDGRRVPFLVYRKQSTAQRAASLVGGTVHEVEQGHGPGVHTPPVVIGAATTARASRKAR